MYILRNFPLPPSSNQLYASVRGRLIKSVEGRKYDAAVSLYKLRKFIDLDKITNAFSNAGILEIETIFVFHRKRIIGLKNQIKKLDTSNRIKPCHDGLARILEIDDCYFKAGKFSIATCDDPKDEQVIIIVNKSELKTLEQINSSI